MTRNLDEIKKAWTESLDRDVILAASIDFDGYQSDVQKIILDEIKSRSLSDKVKVLKNIRGASSDDIINVASDDMEYYFNSEIRFEILDEVNRRKLSEKVFSREQELLDANINNKQDFNNKFTDRKMLSEGEVNHLFLKFLLLLFAMGVQYTVVFLILNRCLPYGTSQLISSGEHSIEIGSVSSVNGLFEVISYSIENNSDKDVDVSWLNEITWPDSQNWGKELFVSNTTVAPATHDLAEIKGNINVPSSLIHKKIDIILNVTVKYPMIEGYKPEVMQFINKTANLKKNISFIIVSSSEYDRIEIIRAISYVSWFVISAIQTYLVTKKYFKRHPEMDGERGFKRFILNIFKVKSINKVS